MLLSPISPKKIRKQIKQFKKNLAGLDDTKADYILNQYEKSPDKPFFKHAHAAWERAFYIESLKDHLEDNFKGWTFNIEDVGMWVDEFIYEEEE